LEKLGHFLVEKALARAVRLDPFAVDDELGNGPLADLPDDLVGGARVGLNIDLGIGDQVLFQEAFGFAAIAAP